MSLPAPALNGVHAPAGVRPSRPLLQRLALAWLRYELDRRVAAELRADERLRRPGWPRAGSGGQVFWAFIQVNLAPRSR